MQEGDEDLVRLAIARLYDIYWPPLYGYLRRRGHPQDASGDLLQGFFVHLLQNDTLKTIDAARGRFRSFLLTALKNFIHNEVEYANALRRAPSDRLISLDVDGEERASRSATSSSATPDEIYEQRWANLVLDRAVKKLERREQAAGRGRQLELLRGYVIEGSEQPSYREIALELGISEQNLRVRVHRLRQRLGSNLRSEVKQTISEPANVDDELRHLLLNLSRAVDLET